MHILQKDLKHGKIKLRIDNADDLWTLNSIIAAGDTVSGSTERKVKIGSGKEEKTAVTRKRMFLTITVEKVEYAADGSALRALGVITFGPEDVPRGEHHSFVLEPGVDITIQKEWAGYVVKKLQEATKEDTSMLVLLFDREEAKFFSVTRRGVQEITRIKGKVAKKGLDDKQTKNFYQELVGELEQRHEKFKQLIAAAPAFWKEYLEKELPPSLKKKTIFTTISAVEKTAIRELLSRPEVQKVIAKNSTLRELSYAEHAMEALGKEHLLYGIKEVGEGVEIGNVATLITTEKFIAQQREKGTFPRLQTILKNCESNKGEVHVLSSDEAMSKIDPLGGVVGIKRW